ncbi:SDR family NAD(P)-dependent oxidoreductase [Amycolatopsis benzoatilytica]|uniref:SDR family NAD(P)-dependent oxidoreductase n=1 Tax=Amycolatopsis benzoatilytica TaxID=346045 RepID=UPI000381D516|nr:SDR family NAD(P)-dependent oxidoreductase [Amycolatopsis benzoatilytica]
MTLPRGQDLISLTGRTAIVTGGAMGIGYGIAYRLAEAGAKVLVADQDEAAAKWAATRLEDAGFVAAAVRADVADQEQVLHMADTAANRFGGIDILVNNAGIYPARLMMDLTAAEFARVVAVNLTGVFLCTQAVARHMIDQGRGGRIVTVTSIDSVHPSSPGLAHYDASKHGVWGFTKNVALELAPHRIWVNAIAPGSIATPGVAAQTQPGTAGVDLTALLESFAAKVPMRRIGDPDDIGRAALFLASDLSSYITGAQLVVDGGILLT